jgi:ribose-phosphate pyrophosphokinase
MVDARPRLISGSTHQELAKEIAELLSIPLTRTTIRRFKDGEIYVKIDESARGDDFFVIQPTCNPVNDSLMELLIMIDALKRASVHSITAVIPYYGYARQDRKASSREPITAKLVADLLTRAGVTRVLTIDLHASQIQGFFDVPVDNLDGVSLISRYFQEKRLENLTIVAPDVGGTRRARMMGKLLDAPIAIIDKRREKHNESEVMHLVGDVKDRRCVLMDDMIDTGGTITKAANALKDAGAHEVYIAATHGVLSGDAIQNLESSVAVEIVLTNTIPLQGILSEKFSVLSVGNLLAQAIGRIYRHESLSALFNDMLSTTPKRLQK